MRFFNLFRDITVDIKLGDFTPDYSRFDEMIDANTEITLTSNDVVEVKADTNSKFKAGIKKQTIGVEIEFTGITRKSAAKVLANYFGTRVRYFGEGYDAYGTIANDGRKWKIMSDCSIRDEEVNSFGERVRSHTYRACELVTPILHWNDIETLKDIVKALSAAGAFVNYSCGLHVHIGAADATARTLRNLVNIVGSRENLFFEMFATGEWRKQYCEPTNSRIIREFNKKKPMTLEEVKSIWYNGNVSRVNSHYDGSRYTIANLHSFFSKGTIEIRIFNSTLDADEVAAAVHFSAALVDMAKRKSKTVYEVVTDRPFERLSNFIGRLKLTGDEFKTTRYHLLKHVASKAKKSAAA